jgi:hypothetical protein
LQWEAGHEETENTMRRLIENFDKLLKISNWESITFLTHPPQKFWGSWVGGFPVNVYVNPVVAILLPCVWREPPSPKSF